MTAPKQHDVFLSYKREDSDIMAHVRDALRADGVVVWTDEYIEITDNKIWQKAIDLALNDSKSLVLLGSNASYESPYVQGEVETAEKLGLTVFPIVIKDMPHTALPLQYRGAQHIDARGNLLESGIEKLLKSLRKKLQLRSVGELERLVETLTTELDDFRQQYAQLQEEHRQIKALEKGSDAEQIKIKAYLERSRRTLHQIEHYGKQKKVALEEAKLESLNQTGSDTVLQVRLQELQKEKEQLAMALAETKQQVSELEAQNQGLKYQLANLQTKLTEVNAQSSVAVSIPELRPTDIVDWFRLLWWVCFSPEKLDEYKRVYGETHHKKAGSWLVSTLMFFPLFVITAGGITNENLLVQNPIIAISPILVLLIIILSWCLIGFFGHMYIGEGILFWLLLLIAGVMVGGLMSIITGDGFVILVVVVVGGIARIMVGGIADGLISLVVGGVAFVVASRGGGSKTLGMEATMVGVVAAIIAIVATLAVRVMFSTRNPLFTVPLFLALVLSNAFIIWVYWLGGAQVLGYIS